MAFLSFVAKSLEGNDNQLFFSAQAPQKTHFREEAIYHAPTMKMLIQTGSSGRVSVPPEKRFPINVHT